MSFDSNSQIGTGYFTLAIKLPAIIKLHQNNKQKAVLQYYKQVQTIDLPENAGLFKNLNFEFSTDLSEIPLIIEQCSIKWPEF